MPLPYPGRKLRTANAIASALRLPRSERVHYIEPFAGTASVGFDLMRSHLRLGSRVTLIDRDPGIIALWTAVRDHPDNLCDAIERVRPSRALWHRCRERDGDVSDGPVAGATRKLVLHRLSWLGRGLMTHAARYEISSEWRVTHIREQIRDRHLAMLGFDVRFHDDALVYLRRAPSEAYVYLDPPYHRLGAMLYRYADRELHGALARVLQGRQRWALHYDDAPAIRAVYGPWANVTTSDAGELLITPRPRSRRMSHAELTRLGIARAVASGAKLGRPRKRRR